MNINTNHGIYSVDKYQYSMIQIILIQKTGRLVNKRVKTIGGEYAYKYCNYTSDKNFEHVHTYDADGYEYEVYGKVEGRANSENKYEFPPPIDDKLFFGMMCMLKKNKVSGEYEDLPTIEWRILYDKLFGGFDDIGDEDSEYSQDSEHSESELTKEGYLKDGFVVDDKNTIIGEYDSDSEGDEDDADESDDGNNNFVTFNSKNEPQIDIEKINRHIQSILKKNNIDLGGMNFNLENFLEDSDSD